MTEKIETGDEAVTETIEKENGENKNEDEEELHPRLRRFERYFERPVAVQLKRQLLMLDYSGETLRTEFGGKAAEYGLLGPALMESEGKLEPVGASNIMPRVVLVPNGEWLLAWIISPMTGATIEVSIDPDDVEFVTYVARMPSKILRGNLS